MKVPLFCDQCCPSGKLLPSHVVFVEIREDGVYTATCPQGHTIVEHINNPKFDILFQIAAWAIIDGYYREAVSSFTSSLERCYEVCIKAPLYERALERTLIDQCWKPIKKQSERQLGAFVATHILEFGSAPQMISNHFVEFRNNVIHNGKIPSRVEAVEYGQAVLDAIRPLIRKFARKYHRGYPEASFEPFHGRSHFDNSGKPVPQSSMPEILGLYVSAFNDTQNTLQEALDRHHRLRVGAYGEFVTDYGPILREEMNRRASQVPQ